MSSFSEKGVEKGAELQALPSTLEFQVCFNFHNKSPVELEQLELTERNFTESLWGFYTIKL